MATFDEIHDAFLFVSSAEYGMNKAILCKDNGEIYYYSEMEEIDELDEDEFDCDNFIHVPHKNDLDLGQMLVFEFVDDQMPDEFSLVQQIFSGRGAYARFKDLLKHKGLLQSWHDFETQREEHALREWVRENEIVLKSS